MCYSSHSTVSLKFIYDRKSHLDAEVHDDSRVLNRRSRDTSLLDTHYLGRPMIQQLRGYGSDLAIVLM